MAHEIEITNGKASVFTVEKPAWHGLGATLEHAQTQEEVLKMGFLDYEVCKQHPQIQSLKGLIEDKTHYAISRCDNGTTFGYVKGRYTLIQNRDAFKFFDIFLEKTEGVYNTAGVLFNGKIAWILAKLPEHITVNGENIEMYVIAVMHHDGKHAMQLMFTPVRVVCWNTLTAATNQCRNIVTINHNKNYEANIKQAVETMQIKNNYVSEITEVFQEMQETKVDETQATQYFNKLVTGLKDVKGIAITTTAHNKIQDYLNYYLNHQTQQTIKGTVFGLYNAVTGLYQNAKEYKTQEQKFNKIMIKGDAQTAGSDAFHLATLML